MTTHQGAARCTGRPACPPPRRPLHSAGVLRDGERVDVPVRDLVRGDVIVLEAGDDVGCDGRLVEAHDLAADDVALTGESAPVRRAPGPAPPGTAAAEAANLVIVPPGR
jgi:P-type Ca2+ transporter type 2C